MSQTPRRRTVVLDRATAQEFIKAWQSSNSVAEVAKKIRCRTQAARLRGMRYRRMGIPLKDFPPMPGWDELAEYAKSLLAKSQPSSDELPA